MGAAGARAVVVSTTVRQTGRSLTSGRRTTSRATPRDLVRTPHAFTTLQRLAGNQAVAALVRRQATDEAARIAAVYHDWDDSVASGDWDRASRTANAFSNEDITTHLRPLTIDQLGLLRAAAVRALPGYSGRVTDAADLLIDPDTRSALRSDEPFDIAELQKIYDGHRATVSTRQLAALRTLDHPLAGMWAHLSWNGIAASAGARVVDPTQIDQRTLGVCGEAAALEADASANALRYADEVRHVFATGDVGGTKVNKALLDNTPESGMDPCDWMMLSAAQDASNMVLDYGGRPRPSWGVSEGTTSGGEQWLLSHFNGCVKTKEISCHFWGEEAATTSVNTLLSRHGENVVVIVSNDGGMLQNDGTGEADGSANHWVRLLAPVTLSDLTTFTVFSWGKSMTLHWDIHKFTKWVYGYVVGARQNDIDLDV